MRRIFTEKITSDSYVLSGEEHKHLSVVLRAKVGDRLKLCCGDGFIYLSEIEKIFKDSTVLKIIDKVADNSESKIVCDLYVGILKGEHMEIALQKCVELGINEIRPIITKNTVKTDVNLARLQKIALEAAKQCGRGSVPKVCAPQKISDIYEKLKDYDCVVFPYEKAKEVDLKKFLQGFNRVKSVAVIIGSEGGFVSAEVEKLSEFTTPITLGSRILRADTACIATVASVMFYFEEFK